MIDGNCGFADDRGAWVLDALPAEEAAAFERHLRSCSACQAEVAALQHVADSLLDRVPPTPAPPALEARVKSAVTVRDRPTETPRGARPERRWVRLAAAGVAAVVLAAAAFAIGHSTTSSSDPEVAERRLAVTGTAARATLREREGLAELVLEDLGPPPRGRIYQLWLRYPRRPLAATNRLFSVSDEGTAVVAVPPIRGVEQLVLTAEPPRGSRSPSAAPVLIADLPSQ